WVWSALAAAGTDAARARRVFALLLLPGVFTWSCLFWDHQGLFLDWYALPAARGPVFFAYAGWAWLLIAAGTLVLLRAVPPRVEGGGRLRLAVPGRALVPPVAHG